MKAPMHCSHCGQAVRHPHGLNLSPHEMTLFHVLFEAFPREVSIGICEHAIYADRRDGGPLSSRSITRVVKCSLDRKLRTRGWTIEGERGLSTYRLMKIYEAAPHRKARPTPVMKAVA